MPFSNNLSCLLFNTFFLFTLKIFFFFFKCFHLEYITTAINTHTLINFKKINVTEITMIDKLKWVCGEGSCFQIWFWLSNSEAVFIYKFLNSNLNCLHRIGLNVREMNSNSSLDLFLVCIQKKCFKEWRWPCYNISQPITTQY